MFRNYLKITMRNIKKFSGYSLINIIGLSTGMVCFALIMLYVNDELSVDKYHSKAENIYRVNVQFKSQATELDVATSGPPWGPTIKKDYPEVIEYARIRKTNNILVEYQGQKFYETGHIYADSSLFSLFDYKFIKGDPNTVLKRPNTAVLSRSIAEKYFGDVDPIGKIITLNADDNYEITGIVEDIPSNTNLQYNILCSYTGRRDGENMSIGGWTDLGNMYTFLLLSDGVNISEFEQKIMNITDKYAGALSSYGISMITSLHPLTDIHLKSDQQNEFDSTSDIRYVYIFSTIAVFILMIACINYMNLATARSSVRIKEVGMRKVLGAKKLQLIKQFLGESILFSTFAAVFAIALIELLLPFFNSMTEKSIDINYTGNIFLTLTIFLSAVLVGVISGSYPAFILSSFLPISMLQRRTGLSQRDSYLRKGLVVFQFTISIVLIAGTIIVSRQLDYFSEKDLGLNPEQILVISLQDNFESDKYGSFKNELIQNSGILGVTASHGTPGKNSGFASIFFEKGKTIEDQKLPLVNSVDYNYIDLYGMEIIEGRNFQREIATDAGSAIIINETLVKELGWDNAIGKELVNVGDQRSSFTVIGVVKDFHHFSLDQVIGPQLMYVIPDIFNFVSVKLKTDNISETIEYIENMWNQFSPNYPIEYSFVDEDFASQYRSTERFGRLSTYFAMLAIIIACLGLFGLSSFTAEQRTKEIGIRKALGSSISSIVILMTKEFTKWILVANVIAWPAAYMLMSSYLEEFAYRVDIGIDTFILSTVAAFAIALFTVSFQAIKSAIANPVNSLRSE
ncbi:MAG: FtsX-like permease family protein [bacterium]|nr:FtsX-like permease family protein [bacterium]